MSRKSTRTRKGKKVLALHMDTGEIEQYTSISGAVIVMKSLYIGASAQGIRESCTGANIPYKERYWSYIE